MGYFDTSVLVAYYCPEPLSRTAEREIRSSTTAAISLLTEVEFTSALALKTRRGELAVASARSILACFQAPCGAGGLKMCGCRTSAATSSPLIPSG